MTGLLARPVPATAVSVRTLAAVEAKRFARHPLFLLGTPVAWVMTWGMQESADRDPYMAGYWVSVFVGLVAIVVGNRLTVSTDGAGDAVAAAPADEGVRTAALCLACFVPAAAGLVGFAVVQISAAVYPAAWADLVAIGAFDRVCVQLGQTAVAGLGGGLLGVAAGRWVRFPGVAALLPVLVVSQVILALSMSPIWGPPGVYKSLWGNDAQDGAIGAAVRLFAPWTTFSTPTDTHVNTWTGSPRWFLVWQLALCVLAAVAALLKDAPPARQRRLLVWFAGAMAIALVSYGLAVTGGLDEVLSVPRGRT